MLFFFPNQKTKKAPKVELGTRLSEVGSVFTAIKIMAADFSRICFNCCD
jgi:hypothetical protein